MVAHNLRVSEQLRAIINIAVVLLLDIVTVQVSIKVNKFMVNPQQNGNQPTNVNISSCGAFHGRLQEVLRPNTWNSHEIHVAIQSTCARSKCETRQDEHFYMLLDTHE